jgi:hypothetical protein
MSVMSERDFYLQFVTKTSFAIIKLLLLDVAHENGEIEKLMDGTRARKTQNQPNQM